MADQQLLPASKPRVLIIDDSRVVRVSLKKILSDEFEIVEANDGEAGWQALLADEKIQVILTDAGMPRLDGYELIARIRAHDDVRINDIPVNMVTAADDAAARQRALDLGATDFITKPFDKAQLLARVRAQARLDQTTRDLAQTAVALRDQATDDALTGVRSRRYLLKHGEQDLAFAARHQQNLSVLVIALDDADRLKAKCSITTLDLLLIGVAGCLQTAIRKEDTLARIADTRFAIIAPTLGGAEAHRVCDRIRQQLASQPFNVGEMQISLTVSIGLSNRGINNIKRIEGFLTLAEKYAASAQAAGGNRLMPAEFGSVQTSKKSISIDAALRILSKGDSEKLTPHIDIMLEQLMPLLDFCNRKQQWGADLELAAIRQKAGSLSGSGEYSKRKLP
ncbi:diguanylate cyclase/phosphodiesterase (GGDEF & EAL domains) with PAS/PAC sensor(s) [hydrothermal vent metagenome]|uniref:Diguanylate cyclase/phosphodiesterase (GGDEF & EAL domains) with PAS/PAC sensor(S) n=1 Tax=hydrothermal vent metagenome TaxID=652676 RepID=A0A3B1A678_9ZZZZ